METFSDQCTTSPCVNPTNQALVDSIICQTFTITRGSIKKELSYGCFLDCSNSKVTKERKKTNSDSKNDILLNHETGRELKDYLVNPSALHSLLQTTQSSSKSLSRAISTYSKVWPLCLVPHDPESSRDTSKSPFLTGTGHPHSCSHSHTIYLPLDVKFPASRPSMPPAQQPCPIQMPRSTPRALHTLACYVSGSFLPFNTPILITLQTACSAPIHSLQGSRGEN